ncbi:hypothetical protein SBOR_8032 [Sclerotinia borealis F-4128]|uniref:Uncharacterized protein n=1 Tax=Sclerotinia borealis (strain F-4128) TaxID=1432307 RepID=W9C4B2_SCLBF|nr:hypothetical protein SBOR_8032 [Sclerotinia borealis F-4128]
MNTATLITFISSLYSLASSAPIDLFTDGNTSQVRAGISNTNTSIPHITRNDYPSAGNILVTFYADFGDFFQQTFPVDGNAYLIDNSQKTSYLEAQGTGYCAITGGGGSFTQTRGLGGPSMVTVNPVGVLVLGQCSGELLVRG